MVTVVISYYLMVDVAKSYVGLSREAACRETTTPDVIVERLAKTQDPFFAGFAGEVG